MRLRLLHRSGREGRLSRAVVIAYAEWRSECDAVRKAYRQWRVASAVEQSVAFDAYSAALDREENAARRYARRMARAGYSGETGLARQFAPAETVHRSW
jgi:hypothetical protein